MISKLLSVFSDILAIVFVWFKDMPIEWKVICTIICIGIAIALCFLEKGPYKAKLVDYEYKDSLKNVFILKRSQFRENSLVSIYHKNHSQSELSAIGYVISNNDNNNEYQVIIVKIFGTTSQEIATTKRSYKDFFVTPVMMFNEVNDLFEAQGGNT